MRIIGPMCLIGALGIVAAAQPAKPKAKVAYTITTDSVTITATDDRAVTMQERGKKAQKLLVGWNIDGVYQLLDDADMSIRSLATKDGDTFTLMGAGNPRKVLATITDGGEAKLPGRAKQVSFDAKGQLVNSARKIKVVPAAQGKQAETMAVLVTLLADRL
jgi:hypothetical protein